MWSISSKASASTSSSTRRTGLEPWFDEKAIRRAAVMARIPTITTLSAARAAAEGIAALQRGEVKIRALQQLHADRSSQGPLGRLTPPN